MTTVEIQYTGNIFGKKNKNTHTAPCHMRNDRDMEYNEATRPYQYIVYIVVILYTKEYNHKHFYLVNQFNSNRSYTQLLQLLCQNQLLPIATMSAKIEFGLSGRNKIARTPFLKAARIFSC